MDYNNIIIKHDLIQKDNYIYKEFMYKKYHIATIQDDGIFFVLSFKYVKLIYKIITDLGGKDCYLMLPGVYNLDLFDYNSKYLLVYETIKRWSKIYALMEEGLSEESYWNSSNIFPWYGTYNTHTKSDYEYMLHSEYNIILKSIFYYISAFKLNIDDIENIKELFVSNGYLPNSIEPIDEIWKMNNIYKNINILKELD